jgi:hypothetical protein
LNVVQEAKQQRHSLSTMFASLAWPLVLGLGATAGFYALVFRGPLHHQLVIRYFAGHPINMIETALFFIGLAALVIKLFDLLGEFGGLSGVALLPPPRISQQRWGKWLKALAELPARLAIAIWVDGCARIGRRSQRHRGLGDD